MLLRPPPLCPWPRLTQPPAAGELLIVLVNLDQDPGVEAACRALLRPEEQAHADRYVFPADRRRYTVGRAALRTLLGQALNQWPEAVALRTGPRGKPLLAQPGADLHFNLSNSADLALIALTRCAEVGVDLELPRALGDGPALARTVFSPAELAALAPRVGPEWTAAFYRLWTRKEAYLKAIGEGLYAPLQEFTVSIDPPVRFVELPGDDPARWTLLHLDPCPGAVGAVALPAPRPRLRCEVL